jgi:hypothetical protein
VLLCTGCGDGGLPPQLTPGQRADLHTLVGQARTAARGGDLAGTQAALHRLDARVRQLRDDGALDGDTAGELLQHSTLAGLKARATLKPAAAGEAPATTTPPPPVAAPPPPPAAASLGKAPKGKARGRAKKAGKKH